MGFFRDFVIDAWSSVAHKLPMRDDPEARVAATRGGWGPAGWVGPEHRRRIAAYTVLAAYEQNSSRHFLEGTDDDRAVRREYGDAALVIDSTLSALLGDQQTIAVAGAEAYEPDLEQWVGIDLANPPEGLDPADAPTPERLAENATARALVERQKFLHQWARDVHLELRTVDVERKAISLGDGVILLGWDERRQRVVPSVMDPGFYFPVLPDTLDAYEYPERVHFAWELPGEDFEDRKTRVRRITYELVELQPIYDEDAHLEAVRAARLDDVGDIREDDYLTLPDGADWSTIEEDGVRYRVVTRAYPWQGPGEEPSRMTCTVTDATWLLDDLNDAQDPDAFSLDNASIRIEGGEEVRDLDLGIDFLPIVHIPNTPPGGDHYGQSSLSRVLQIIDDLQSADTDGQAASATTGSPIIGISGSATEGDRPLTGQRRIAMEVEPGAVWRLGENGRMDVLNTAANLQACREYVQQLRDRLLVNARLPAALVGTLKPNEVPSGFAMQLSFGPLTGMIRTMRLVRGVKYPLLLRMVQRLYQANGVLEDGPTPFVEYVFGSYLPADQAGTLKMVTEAYKARVISLETAVTMLLEAGFPVDDIAAEIALIESRDFEGANALADLGDVDAALTYLGRPPATPDDGQGGNDPADDQ